MFSDNENGRQNKRRIIMVCLFCARFIFFFFFVNYISLPILPVQSGFEQVYIYIAFKKTICFNE